MPIIFHHNGSLSHTQFGESSLIFWYKNYQTYKYLGTGNLRTEVKIREKSTTKTNRPQTRVSRQKTKLDRL